MCGIVGYIGSSDTKEILLKRLEKLEYRGYDSGGIAVKNETETKVLKEKGRIADLRKREDEDFSGTTGIGHTRWATHGEPRVTNSHPHQSADKRSTLVHNGVIEKYKQLKEKYLNDTKLMSDTDTEIIVQLVAKFAQEGSSTLEAFQKPLSLLHGSYAIGLLDNEDDHTIYAAKNKAPLLLGKGDG